MTDLIETATYLVERDSRLHEILRRRALCRRDVDSSTWGALFSTKTWRRRLALLEKMDDHRHWYIQNMMDIPTPWCPSSYTMGYKNRFGQRQVSWKDFDNNEIQFTLKFRREIQE
jgi:hypothetical protein